MVFDVRRINADRPRAYEDPSLAEIEGSIVGTVLEAWGYYEQPTARPGDSTG
jgi:hypothetical protein